jgi:hypothetical protein
MMRQLRLILTKASEKLLPHISGLTWPVKRTSFMMRQLTVDIDHGVRKAFTGQLRGPAYGETAQVNIGHGLRKTVTS